MTIAADWQPGRWRIGHFAGVLGAGLLAVVMLGGIIHVAVIFLVPRFAERDVWSRLAAVAGDHVFAPVRAQAAPGLDPLFLHAACRFSLEIAPTSLTFGARDWFWSLALYDRDGVAIFSLNDRTAIEGRLDMLVVSPAQNAQLRENPPPGMDQTIAVETAASELIALLRFYSPTPAARAEAEAILSQARCAAVR